VLEICYFQDISVEGFVDDTIFWIQGGGFGQSQLRQLALDIF